MEVRGGRGLNLCVSQYPVAGGTYWNTSPRGGGLKMLLSRLLRHAQWVVGHIVLITPYPQGALRSQITRHFRMQQVNDEEEDEINVPLTLSVFNNNHNNNNNYNTYMAP